MAITVRLSDATVAVGGTFANALSFVKSFAGRSFDGQSKTWTVPTDLKTFRNRCSFPLDVLSAAQPHLSGQHITKWGTRYSRDEWDAKREYDAIRVPDALAVEAIAKQGAAERRLVATLASFGLSEQAVAKIRGIEKKFMGDWDYAVECGHIVFSSPERQAQIERAFETYYDAYLKADDAVEAWIGAEQRRIDEKHGLV